MAGNRPEKAGLTRRQTILAGAMCGAALALPGTVFAAARKGQPLHESKPNIIFILADDLGFADLSCYGHNYQTPNIDRLAAEGVKFTQAYANSAICSSTRTALITGRYQYRLPVGLDEPISGKKDDLGLDPAHPTMPSLLRKAGYRTALVGKWHLGHPPKFGPLKSGYDSFYGIHHGWAYYFDHHQAPPEGLYHNDMQTPQLGYMTDVLGDRAVEEIRSAKAAGKPLFLSLHFTAPHWPWETPEDALASPEIADPQNYDAGSIAIYQKMLTGLDRNVAKVLTALEETGQTDNSIVIFTSDNGGERFSDTWPLTGMKGELLEGGIRVPVVMRWPGRIQAGSACDQVTMSMDWLPTLLAAGGGAQNPAYPSDGIDLWPILNGTQAVHPRKLFWRYKAHEQAAFRDGDWKYLKLDAHEWLFNVVDDARERANRAAHEPERFARMKAEYAQWSAKMLPYPANSDSHSNKGLTADRY